MLLKEKELTDYLKYLRCKQPPKKIVLNDSILKDVSTNVTHGKPKKACNLVRTYVEQYLRLMR